MNENYLPRTIQALEYEETCGRTVVGEGIIMVDDNSMEICRLNRGTIREGKIALLWAAAPQLLTWAKEACETERALYENGDDRDPPSWLAELEAAVHAAENG